MSLVKFFTIVFLPHFIYDYYRLYNIKEEVYMHEKT